MRWPLLTPLALLLLPNPAWACGGIFCDSLQPVDQSAERIIFSFDGQMLDTEVQITYQGQDDDFAWVVPVPAEPELYESNDAFFTQLANATVPAFTLLSDSTGGSLACGGFAQSTGATLDSAAVPRDGANGVSVVSEQTVGPYDTVVLQATSSDVLVTWLQDQGYSLPDALSESLAPYAAEGQYFVALKLSSDKSTGDLAPLGMRYAATAASIPIQLTAIAATPDLPIEVFVLGPSRAVPDNYLHVQINEAAIDWYNGGTNYRDVVAKAADEAGGQAFATDFVGSPAGLVTLWSDSFLDLPSLAAQTDPLLWVESIGYSGIPGSSQLNALLVRFVPPPAGVDDATFLSCPSCYAGQVSAPDFDPVAATAAFETEIVDVLRDEQQRVDGARTLTRMFTTMDPEEMTADPLFVFNEDLPQEVSQTHTATDHAHYSVAGTLTARTLELADGRTYHFPDSENPTLSAVDTPAALVVEDLGATGEGTVVFDGTADAAARADEFSAGCAAEDSAAGAAPLLVLAAGLLRRRRA